MLQSGTASTSSWTTLFGPAESIIIRVHSGRTFLAEDLFIFQRVRADSTATI
ncbi:unnamed protein product [Tenebrio molitor]|nr:unnamed protein product [Tenebrio molitor]